MALITKQSSGCGSMTHVRAASLALALALGAGVALTAVAAALCPATAQELKWASQAGGIAFTEPSGIATDGRGNSYVAGDFFGSATFGAGEDKETALTAAGDIDMFLAKYDRKGLLLWATSAGGTEIVAVGGIAIDHHGNSYVAGYFFDTAIFGAGEEQETVLTAAGDIDMFVAKYDRKGFLVWARSAGGPDELSERIADDGIASDSRCGSSRVAGDLLDVATLVADEDNETALTSASTMGTFIAQNDRSGTPLGAASGSGTEGDVSQIVADGIAADDRGNSHVSGYFRGTATLGAGEHNETVLTAAGPMEMFVAKYDRKGQLLWATQTHSTESRGHGIAIDGSGNSYVTGCFNGTATYGAGEENETVLTASGPVDMFVAKYDRKGRLLWATKASNTAGYRVAADGRGRSHVTGCFHGAATFGAGEDNETVLTGAGNPNMFIAKYDRKGRLLWARKGVPVRPAVDEDQQSIEGHGIAIDGRGSSYVTGRFAGTARLGEGEVNETELSSAGGDDIYVAKYDRHGILLWASQAGGALSEFSSGIAADGRGNSYVTGYFQGTATFGAGEVNQTVLDAVGSYDLFVAKYGQLMRGDPTPRLPRQDEPDTSPLISVSTSGSLACLSPTP